MPLTAQERTALTQALRHAKALEDLGRHARGLSIALGKLLAAQAVATEEQRLLEEKKQNKAA
jgi:hypothetical protein